MAVGLSRHMKDLRDTRIEVMVYKSDKNSKYTADITVNGDSSLSTGGLLDKEAIINYMQTALKYAQAYLDFLARSPSVDSEIYNLKELRKHLELALAHTLAYEYKISEDDA